MFWALLIKEAHSGNISYILIRKKDWGRSKGVLLILDIQIRNYLELGIFVMIMQRGFNYYAKYIEESWWGVRGVGELALSSFFFWGNVYWRWLQIFYRFWMVVSIFAWLTQFYSLLLNFWRLWSLLCNSFVCWDCCCRIVRGQKFFVNRKAFFFISSTSFCFIFFLLCRRQHFYIF